LFKNKDFWENREIYVPPKRLPYQLRIFLEMPCFLESFGIQNSKILFKTPKKSKKNWCVLDVRYCAINVRTMQRLAESGIYLPVTESTDGRNTRGIYCTFESKYPTLLSAVECFLIPTEFSMELTAQEIDCVLSEDAIGRNLSLRRKLGIIESEEAAIIHSETVDSELVDVHTYNPIYGEDVDIKVKKVTQWRESSLEHRTELNNGRPTVTLQPQRIVTSESVSPPPVPLPPQFTPPNDGSAKIEPLTTHTPINTHESEINESDVHENVQSNESDTIVTFNINENVPCEMEIDLSQYKAGKQPIFLDTGASLNCVDPAEIAKYPKIRKLIEKGRTIRVDTANGRVNIRDFVDLKVWIIRPSGSKIGPVLIRFHVWETPFPWLLSRVTFRQLGGTISFRTGDEADERLADSCAKKLAGEFVHKAEIRQEN